MLRRRIYLLRFGVPTNTHQTYLTFCSKHRLQTETFDVEYKTLEGDKVTKACKFVVHVDSTAPSTAPTRASRLLVHSPPPKPIRSAVTVQVNTDSEEEVPLLELDFCAPYKKKRFCAYHRCNVRCENAMISIPALPKQISKQFYTHNYDRLLRAS
jgi:hypothetical protein